MPSGSDEARDFVSTLARDAVDAVAPEELPFFAASVDAYLADPERALAGRRRADEVLGSGVDVVVELVSPVALAVAAAVYTQLTDKAGAAVLRTGGRMLDRLRARFRRRESAPPLPARLTEEQLAEVRAVARQRALALGLTEDKAGLLVDAMMFSLSRRDRSPDDD